MFSKKRLKTIDMSTGELLKPIVVPYHTRVKYIGVDTINGKHEHYRNVGYRKTDNMLVIKTDKGQIFFNMDNVIRYYYELEDTPHT